MLKLNNSQVLFFGLMIRQRRPFEVEKQNQRARRNSQKNVPQIR